jgi:dihydrofolate reductase
MGRRLFDVVDGPHGWNDEVGYGAGHAATPPFFVVTHAAPDDVRLDLRFTFVTDGIAAAVEQAKAAAGDGDVIVMGGADVVRQSIETGLADKLRIHLAPVLLGGGTPLFGTARAELTPTSSVASKHATHLTYRLR